MANSIIQKQSPAFTFVFRTHGGSEKQLHDRSHIKSACREILKRHTADNTDNYEALAAKCESLIDKIDFQSGASSLALFVSTEKAEAETFYLFLPEVFYCGENFSSLESTYARQISAPYLYFNFSPAGVDVYLGRGLHTEMLDKSEELQHFQAVYSKRPTAKCDKDGRKSEGFDHHFHSELFDAWKKLAYKHAYPCYATGLELIGVSLDEVKSFGIDMLYGTGHSAAKGDLKDILSTLKQEHRNALAKTYAERLETAQGAHKLVVSSEEILDLAKAGQGETLLLEDPEWMVEKEQQLSTIHEAIAEVVKFHGKVEFMPKSSLAKWGGQALILRY